MISTNEGYTRLEYFSEDVAADKNRKEFDIKNHTFVIQIRDRTSCLLETLSQNIGN